MTIRVQKLAETSV